jgi:hypothetical protein
VRFNSARIGATACSTFSRTVNVSISFGSCGTKPTVLPSARRATPSYSLSTPAMMRSRVDLPAPFWPMTPILAPSRKTRLTSFSTGFLPW